MPTFPDNLEAFIADRLDVPHDWVRRGPAIAGTARLEVTPPLASFDQGNMPADHPTRYTVEITERALVGGEAGAAAVLRQLARLRGELEHDGHLISVRAADEDEGELMVLVRNAARAAGFTPGGHALFEQQRAEAVVALTQLLGQVAEAQRNGKGDQLRAELVQLAGHAMATSRAVVGRG